MDVRTLRRIDEWTWTAPLAGDERRAPIILYVDAALLAAMDEQVLVQLRNVAHLPGLVGAALALPDAHWGYGFPIGGVAAFDPQQGGVLCAGGVGFDISCGIRLLRSNLELGQLRPLLPRLAEALFAAIPAGMGQVGPLTLSPAELDDVLAGGAAWAVAAGFGSAADLVYVEERGCLPGATPRSVSELAKRRQQSEMGTLGSGNHYLEVQAVTRLFDPAAAEAFGLREGQVVVSIHCGSRGLGHQIGTDYLVSLAKAAARLGLRLPDRELACAPIDSPEGQAYLGAVRAGSNCALANRQILAQLTRDAFGAVCPSTELETLYDVSHNTCKAERHVVDTVEPEGAAGTANATGGSAGTKGGGERLLYVHRKGATRALGPGHSDLPPRYRPVGQPVVVGGSMGTASYVLAGVPSGERRAFASASHGAGRAMSRHQALRRWHGRELVDELAGRGILIRTRSLRGAAEEAPGAYKDVDLVAAATEAAGLARRVAALRPLVCIKG